MARIELAPGVGDDLARILDHLEKQGASHVAARVGEIIAAIDVLATNPLIGRAAGKGKRELVIGQGPHGYVALYRHVARLDTVFILAVRAQREAGFSPRSTG